MEDGEPDHELTSAQSLRGAGGGGRGGVWGLKEESWLGDGMEKGRTESGGDGVRSFFMAAAAAAAAAVVVFLRFGSGIIAG